MGFASPEGPLGVALHKGFTAEYWLMFQRLELDSSCSLAVGDYPASGLLVTTALGFDGLPRVAATLVDSTGLSPTAQLAFDWPLGDFAYLAVSYDGFALELCMGDRQTNHFDCASEQVGVPVVEIAEGTIFIGSNPDYGCEFFGSIDELAIYDRALGAPLLQKHYLFALGMNPDEPPPPPPPQE